MKPNKLRVLVNLASSGSIEKYIGVGTLRGIKNFEVANNQFGFSNSGFAATSASMYASGAFGVFASGAQNFTGEVFASSTIEAKAQEVRINQFTFLSESSTLIGENLVLTEQLNIRDTGFLNAYGEGGLAEVIHGITWNIPVQVSSSGNINHAIVKDSSGSFLLSNNIQDLTLWGQTSLDLSSYGGNLTLLAQNDNNKVILSGSGGIILSSSAKVRTTNPSYPAINIVPVAGLYDLDTAISGVNSAILNGSSINAVTAAYDNLRYVATGAFDAIGYAEIDLTTAGGAKFITSEINNISLDIMIDEASAGYWTNGLVSVKLQTSASSTWVILEAPALNTNSKWKLIAVNEARGKFTV